MKLQPVNELVSYAEIISQSYLGDGAKDEANNGQTDIHDPPESNRAYDPAITEALDPQSERETF